MRFVLSQVFRFVYILRPAACRSIKLATQVGLASGRCDSSVWLRVHNAVNFDAEAFSNNRILLLPDDDIIIIIIIIMAGMAVFNVAGYLIEERRRWPVITASPRGQCSK